MNTDQLEADEQQAYRDYQRALRDAHQMNERVIEARKFWMESLRKFRAAEKPQKTKNR